MPKLIFTFPDKTQMKYALPLERGHTAIGRAPNNKIVLNHTSISASHACIDRITGGFMLIDLHSTNGLRENNVRQTLAPLKAGRVYKIGDIVLECQYSPEEITEFASETHDSSFSPVDMNAQWA